MSYFVLTNDPDHGILDDYRRVFSELGSQGIVATTAVFCVLKDDGSALARHCRANETHCLADDAYRNFMLELRDQGHEIAFHGYSQVSDTRDEFQRGLEIFRRTFGAYPGTYVEHGGHPRSHPPGMCKRENLKVEGASPGSPYFVKDLVRDVFDAVWTHDYLLDGVYEPLPAADVFHVEDGIRYFKRSRMNHVEKLVSNLTAARNTIVGYTHFGYRGYESRSFAKRLLNRSSHLEWWSARYSHLTVARLARLLSRHGLRSLTLSDLLRTSQEDATQGDRLRHGSSDAP